MDAIFEKVGREDSERALVYRDGILDYDTHDSILRSLGYEFLDAPCACGGSNDDGHMPTCGWGRLPHV